MSFNEWLPVADIAKKVRTKDIKAVDMVKKSLQQIDKHAEFKAVLEKIEDRALERARQIDNTSQSKQNMRLAGVPFIAKDNILTFGSDTTAASNILRGFKAPYQATVIERLEAEGAICVAKANLDAFGHGASTENSDFQTTLNPYDKNRVPGGSSGGPAAAITLGLAPFAVGTDTGGSNRQPASFSGCVGYKPTYGLVSRSGVIAMASSTDTVGPLARTVDDLSVVLDVIAGKDSLDSTTIDKQTEYSDLTTIVKGKKIGLLTDYMTDDVSSEVRKAVLDAKIQLGKQGAHLSDISIPTLKYALACYYIICPAEISSNLSRYDGQRFGYSAEHPSDLTESYEKSRSMAFGKEAKRRIMIGTYVLSSGYYDAYYKKAQQLRTKLIEDFKAAFNKVDFLIGPVAPSVAFALGEKTKDPLQMYLADIMTVAANLVGIPAISVPLPVDGLPVGLQIMAAHSRDKELLCLARDLERVVSS